MASTLRGRREGSRQPAPPPLPPNRSNPASRRGSGNLKNSPPVAPTATNPTITNLRSGDSPLTPIEDTPHPSKGKNEISSNAPKIPALATLLPPPSESSSAAPSQVPSSITIPSTSKDSSPRGEEHPLLLPSNPPPMESARATNTINLDDSYQEPPQRSSADERAEEALRSIRELDATFYLKKPDALWAWDTLEKRVKGYANYKELRIEDIVDLGVPLSGFRARFRVHPALLADVQDTAEEFECLLAGLRAQDPVRSNDPVWRADPTGVFFKALEGARTLASLNIAWKGLVARMNTGMFVYAKYLGRAYNSYGAWEGEPPNSPASTTASFRQEIERYPLAGEKVKFALGAIPRKYWPDGLHEEGVQSGEGRARLVSAPDEKLAPVPNQLATAFPEREPEENPAEITHDGYRHYLQGASGERSADNSGRDKGKQREEDEGQGNSERVRGSERSGRESTQQGEDELAKDRRLHSEKAKELDLKRRERQERAERARQEQEERSRRESIESALKEQAERRKLEEEGRAERRRIEERRAARLRAENTLLDHRIRLEKERTQRLEDDEEIAKLAGRGQPLPDVTLRGLLDFVSRCIQRENRISWDARELAKTAEEEHEEELCALETERAQLAEQRGLELEEVQDSLWEERNRRWQEEKEQRKHSEDLAERRLRQNANESTRATDAAPRTEREEPRKEKVNFSEREEVLEDLPEDWDGDDEEEEALEFPETPAPRGRGERGGRRTSVYSFFGQTTPRRTPFGDAILPPPLNRGGDAQEQTSQRRRSGLANIPAAFTGRPPPDGGGGDSSDDDDDRPPPRGPGDGRGPPRDPPRTPHTPRAPRGNENSKPTTPKRRKSGGGGPPGDPDDNGSNVQPAPTPRQPHQQASPTISPVLKSSNIPAWDGNRATAITYFWKINQLARNNRPLADALGFWLWQRLSDGSSVESWYMTVSEPSRDWMQTNAYNWIQGLVDGYLGRRWVNQIASEFKQQSFREGHKHRHESPLDFISRRLMFARFLGYATQGSREELQLIVERVPPHWHHMLSTSTLHDADELKERVIEFENELLAGARQDASDLESSVAAILKKHGVVPSARATPPRSSLRKVAFAAESSRGEETDETADDLPGLQERENESSDEEGDPWEEMLASAYSIVQKRAPPASKTYPFKRRDDVRTKEKRRPPAPCFSCGSPYHWNKECPHREEYQSKRAKEGFTVEPGEASREKAYDAAYAMIASPGFEKASPETTAGPSEESKSALEVPEPGHEEEEDQLQASEIELEGKVLFVNTPNVASRIEVIEEEYWQEGGALPADYPHIMEYVGDQAAYAVQPEIRISGPAAEEKEVFAIPDVRPYEEKPTKLKSKIKRPPGQASVGTSVLSVKGRVGSLSEEEIDLRLDSCASLTLLSALLYDNLKNPPPIKKGAKMKLWQLTSASDPIRGYVRLPVFITTDDGAVLEMEIEAYVVENMTVPILLGEDFQQAYEVSVDRKVDEGTRVHFGDEEDHPITASNVDRTPDFDKIAKAYRGEVPEKSYARRAHRQKLKRERRRRQKIAKEEEFTVRAATDTLIPAQKAVRVPLRGPFEEGGEWIIEKTLLATSDSLHLAVPNTLISHLFPFVPVANLSHTPKKIRAGEIIGKIAIPGDYFDSPREDEDRRKLEEHALFLKTVCNARLDQDQREQRSHGRRTTQTEAGRRNHKFDMPDERTYDAWKAGQRPAKRKFYMPDQESYSSWANEDEDEQEQYGPKTAAMPETEDIASSEFLKTLDIGALPDHLKERAWNMLNRHKKAFALDGRLGDYEAAARIRVKEGTTPIAVPMFGASPAKKAVIDEQIDKWFHQGVIEESKSPWSAPVVIAYRNGKPRFCVDYRRLNAATIPDEFPIPRQQEILASLSGAQVLSSLDALSGFTQLSVHPDDVEKTAFRTHRGLFQFKRLPFGLRNGPSIFQRVMNSVLAPYLWLFALVYIDDIVVYSRSFEDHIAHLDKVLQAIEDAKITLSPAKCHLFYDSIILLGHKVSRLGLSTHYEKVRAVLEMKRPNNRSELATFLGMTVYFNAFIPYYSDICSPLHALLKKGAPWRWGAEEEFAFLQAKKALQNAPVLGHPIEGLPYRLYTDASDYALGCALQQVQPMKIADLKGTKTYDRLKSLYEARQPLPRLVTRISGKVDDVPPPGQWADDFEDTTVHVERVIGYWSRSFKGAESRYSATEREALAAKEGLVKFQPFLEGSKILLVTDHSALQWARTYENSNRRLASWGIIYAGFAPGLEIVHRAGRVHSNVDPLSRIPREPPAHVSPAPQTKASITTDDAEATLREEGARRKAARRAFADGATGESFMVQSWEDCVVNAPEAYATRRSSRLARRGAGKQENTGKGPTKEDAQDETKEQGNEETAQNEDKKGQASDEMDHTGEPLDELQNREAYRRLFEGPPAILVHLNPDRVKEFVDGYMHDPHLKGRYQEAQESSGEWTPGRRFFRDESGLLYFLDADYVPRLCVPASQRRRILEEAHENPIETAHGGHFKLWAKLRSKFYWQRMKADLEKFCASCDVCQKSKLANAKRFGTLIPNPVPHLPYESVSMDFITELPPSCGFDAILVLVDRFSKHAQFVPTETKLNKKGFARLFVKHLVCKFGVPSSLIMDRDSRWAFDFWKEVAGELKTDLLMSSAHHPQHDGQTEVLNRHLETMLRAYVSQDPEEWANFIHFLEFAYNSTKHKSTREEPFQLLLGFKPRSPTDFLNKFGQNAPKGKGTEASQFLEMLQMKREAARDAIAKAQEDQAKEYNKGRKPVPDFKTGDRVLVNPHSLKWIESKGPGRKLHQRWIGPFEVVQRINPNTYRLRMDDRYTNFPVFNIDHLKLYHEPPEEFKEGRTQLGDTRDGRMAHGEFEIDRILEHKWDARKKKQVYKIRWSGYGPRYDSWRTELDLKNAADTLKEYKEEHGL